MRLPASFVALAITVAACSTLHARAEAQPYGAEGQTVLPTATDADYGRVVAQAVESYILPGYRQLADATASLATAAADFCIEPSPTGKEAIRSAFRTVLVAWAGVDFLRFGPMAEDGRYERFAYWPDKHGTGARQLRRFLSSTHPKLLEDGALSRQSAAVQGLPALESLLFAGDKALLNVAVPEDFRCHLAAAVADNVARIAKAALGGWTGPQGWAERIMSPAPDNPVYRTSDEAMTEILKGILTGLEQLRDQRVLPALGATAAGAKASRAPYWRSGLTLVYLSAGAKAIEAYVEAASILALLPPEQAGYGASAEFEFANLIAAFEAAGDDIEAALKDDPKSGKLAYAAIVLASLRDLFQNRISVAAGLTAGFNSMDGD